MSFQVNQHVYFLEEDCRNKDALTINEGYIQDIILCDNPKGCACHILTKPDEIDVLRFEDELCENPASLMTQLMARSTSVHASKKTILITGAEKSGKTRFAELLQDAGLTPVCYHVTALPASKDRADFRSWLVTHSEFLTMARDDLFLHFYRKNAVLYGATFHDYQTGDFAVVPLEYVLRARDGLHRMGHKTLTVYLDSLYDMQHADEHLPIQASLLGSKHQMAKYNKVHLYNTDHWSIEDFKNIAAQTANEYQIL